ncbi:MAG: phosphotransferase [Limnochordales bacterium]|nr:phosphotransferase [Limnochordales bacterium]
MEEALTMARLAAADGTGTIVATPHALHSRFRPEQEAVAEAFNRLSAALAENRIPLRLQQAAEVSFAPDLRTQLEAHPELTVNGQGRYVLTELPFVGYPTYVTEVCFDLLLHGIVPIIAHPERSQHLQQHPHLLYELVAQGVMVQVNAGSLLGQFGPEAEAAARLFVRHRMVHLLGSDAHNSQKRPPVLQEAASVVAELGGEELARNVTVLWPGDILAGIYVQVAEPIPIKYHGPIRSSGRPVGLWQRIKARWGANASSGG